MLGFRLPVISDNIVTLFFGMLDRHAYTHIFGVHPENVGRPIGVEISMLYPICKLSYGGGNFYPPPSLAGTFEKFR